MRRVIVIVQAGLAAIGTASCAADNQARIEAQRQDQIAKIIAADDMECRGYGLKPDTQPYIDCRMTIAKQRKDPDAVRDIATQQTPRF